MSTPPQHHFMQNMNNMNMANMNNNPVPMRAQFGPGPMQNQMGNGLQMQSQLGCQMPPQMANQMNPMITQMASQLANPIGSPMPTSNQMLGQMNQQYGMQHQAHMQMQPSMAMAPSSEYPGGMQHHPMQNQAPIMPQQAQQAAKPPANVVSVPTGPQQPVPPVQQQVQQHQQQQQPKELNTASLCRIGQETVQDIVSRTQEVFQTLKSIQPPNGTPQSGSGSIEKKAKVQELFRTIRVLFKRLRLIYEKCNENCQLQGMEYTHIESLITFKDEMDPKHDEKKNSEYYRLTCEESKEIMEQVIHKNKQLKEVIDHLRRIIWEINTMLTMRRS